MQSVLTSWQAILVVASLSAVYPVVSRLLSPVALLLLSPFLAVIIVVVFLTSHILIAYALDSVRPKPVSNPNPLLSAARPLAFSTPAAWQVVTTRSQWSRHTPQTLPPLEPWSPSISGALNDILTLIVRDFVLTWYTNISASPQFPTSVSSTLHGSVQSLLGRLHNLDIPTLLVRRIIPKVTAHVEQFRQAEVALRGAGLERHLTQSDELDLLLASRYAGKGGKLHPAVDNLSSTMTKQTEENHLRKLVEKALPFILPKPEADSAAVRLVSREIVTCSVLMPVLDMVTDPDFWNQSIDRLAGAAIREQKLISKVRHILETQSPSAVIHQAPQLERPARMDDITVRTGARHFESFLRSISRCDSLLDARRLKNDISIEIRRTRELLEKHGKEEWINGEKAEDVVAHLDRLYTAKRKAEKRIAVLGGAADDSRQSVFQGAVSSHRFTLRDVLSDPGSISYFMEFMDRRSRSLLVQFWLTVESFKDPLESVDSASSDEDSDRDTTSALPLPSPTIKEDMSLIHDLYFSSPSPSPLFSAISRKHVDAIRSFASDPDPSTSHQRKVRKSVLLAQRQVEQDMEEDFADFEKSDLWFRAISAVERDVRTPLRPPSLIEPLASPPPSLRPMLSPTSSVNPPSTQQNTPPLSSERLSRSTSSLDRPRHHRGTAAADDSPKASNLHFLISSNSDLGSEIDSRSPLFGDADAHNEEAERMEAIEAALTDIIAQDMRYSGPGSTSSLDLRDKRSPAPRVERPAASIDRGSRIFLDDEPDVGEDDNHDDVVDEDDNGRRSMQLAAPGDLQLAHEIARLADKIGKLESQQIILDTLVRKAELTGDSNELRLLNKSKSAMTREMRELTFQKTQYEQQEANNRLIPERTRVAITNSVMTEEEGKQVVRYLIEVQQLATDGSFSSGWGVARRYSEFFVMNQRLRDRFVAVRNLDFPGKRLVTSLSNSFVDTRRSALEKYLQGLVSIPLVCESEELLAFLSRQSMSGGPVEPPRSPRSTSFPGQHIVRNVYRSVADSIDDMFFGPSMLEVMIQRLSKQAAELAGISGASAQDEDLVVHALSTSGRGAPEDTLLRFPGDLKPLEGETSTSAFTGPICDLVLAMFELDKKNNWLRRQAVVIILQQVLGGTIERKLREITKQFLDESHLMGYIRLFRDGLWPGGRLKSPGTPRTQDEKLQTREQANQKLSALIPDLAANMIGRANARRGARRMFTVMQNRRLNQHIMYTIIDEVFGALFPEISL